MFLSLQMPYEYVRKTRRGSWSPENMTKAVEACLRGELSVRSAAQTYNVPKSTLSRMKLSAGAGGAAVCKSPSLGRKPTLGVENEEDLATLILDMESRDGFGLTKQDVCSVAYEFAECNNIPHNFNAESKKAGRFWMEGFLKRHPRIVAKKPEGLSMNRKVVQQYFGRLGATTDREQFHQQPWKIYNVDERLYIVFYVHENIITKRGEGGATFL